MPLLASLASRAARRAPPLLLPPAPHAATVTFSPLPTPASLNAPLASSERRRPSYALGAVLPARLAMATTEAAITVSPASLAITSILTPARSLARLASTGTKESV